MFLQQSARQEPGADVARLLRLAAEPQLQKQVIESLGGKEGWLSIIEAFCDRDRLGEIRELAEQVLMFAKYGEKQDAEAVLLKLQGLIKDKEIDDGMRLSDFDVAGV